MVTEVIRAVNHSTDRFRSKATTNKIREKLEDLKVLRRSPDLFNHVKIGQGQLQGILIKHILFHHIWEL